MTYNASDPKKVARRQEREGLLRKQQLEDIKAVLNTPAGMRLMRRFFESGKIFKTTFTGNSNGYFLEGHRNHALMYFKDVVDACPEKVPELIMDDPMEDLLALEQDDEEDT